MAAVTVITAAFNCSRTLKCALASLRDQSFADFEALIVGDCCTDDSECIVRGSGMNVFIG
jgi:glycosyltransferase involved in cell wall biosynthesis